MCVTGSFLTEKHVETVFIIQCEVGVQLRPNGLAAATVAGFTTTDKTVSSAYVRIPAPARHPQFTDIRAKRAKRQRSED